LRKNPKPLPQPKQKWKFMQKYFHKGVFFQTPTDDHVAIASRNDIFKLEFSSPIGEDKMDKTILPKVMSVKIFDHSEHILLLKISLIGIIHKSQPYSI
jgi:microfibrillar-associated protein 1